MSYIAEFVTTMTRDGVTLAGTLRRPPTGKDSQIDADVVILHHGVGGKFYGSAMFDAVSEHLLAAGCAVLRVNSRGHDLITTEQRNGQPVRFGAAFETCADCVHDWRAWTDFAEAQGFRAIAVWGHRLGGVKTIYSLGAEPDPRVRWAVSSSPPRFNYPMFLAGPDAAEFQVHYQQARALVDQGEGRTLYTSRTCQGASQPAPRRRR